VNASRAKPGTPSSERLIEDGAAATLPSFPRE
jgi:hypothetical protein